jgi:hypothetical protein
MRLIAQVRRNSDMHRRARRGKLGLVVRGGGGWQLIHHRKMNPLRLGFQRRFKSKRRLISNPDAPLAPRPNRAR